MVISNEKRRLLIKPSLADLRHVGSPATESKPQDREEMVPAGSPEPPTSRSSDAKLRAQTDMILAVPVTERLHQLEAEAAFFSSLRPLGDTPTQPLELVKNEHTSTSRWVRPRP